MGRGRPMDELDAILASSEDTEEAPELHAADPSKKKKRKRRKKQRGGPSGGVGAASTASEAEDAADEIEIEYVTANDLQEDDPAHEEFRKIFDRFTKAEALAGEGTDAGADSAGAGDGAGPSGDSGGADGNANEKSMSKKQRKKLKRLSIAELKQLVKRPDVVEAWDVTSADPRLLVYLKSYRNTVPVPKHWNQKRKYLQGKRGIEKPAFKLPDFIEATGIAKIRATYQEREDAKKLKQKQREKMQPKMGKMDIDYQVLHDAFFKFQTKPKMTIHGDLYYEGKEFEVRLKEKRPGQLSEDLRRALGMTNEAAPPPWLINMQRYGPPPSYPTLKIAGLNAPIPPGCQFGFHPGGWGKPPVDEYGRPLYGDVFGTMAQLEPVSEPVDRTHWGDIEEEEEEPEEPEQAAEEAPEAPEQVEEKHVTEEEVAAGISSVPSGLETPEVINLRKQQKPEEEARPLFRVLEEQKTAIQGGLLGTQHGYAVSGAAQKVDPSKRVDLMKSQKTDKVEITLNPSDMENLDDAALSAKYEEKLREEREAKAREDLGDVFDEQAKKKRKKESEDKSKKSKKKDKDSDYKF
eukprot:tig00000829_g4665.t1